MIKFKYILCITILGFGMNYISYSQEKSVSKEEIREDRKAEAKAFYESLNLTEEQKPEFKNINEKYKAEIKSMRSSDLDKNEKHNRIKEIHLERDKELKALLTSDQYELYLKRKQEMKNNRLNKRG
ncbi:Spy/CpxP family protein refolding chaperone [Marinigracilibium pacificum]|uniref:LTXXQ motif family protein n=1 Tax=Marinigracilibium pacificum TaxID=2729599 RepID=A0A848J098_9BACT|nr:Spy/CpxP family protein refolding chaperone [Marinigracilibium pacificum]NMM47689.1 hypothetical protein [Marinigracilibium pacificum]